MRMLIVVYNDAIDETIYPKSDIKMFILQVEETI
jgi:hypothetical protein